MEVLKVLNESKQTLNYVLDATAMGDEFARLLSEESPGGSNFRYDK